MPAGLIEFKQQPALTRGLNTTLASVLKTAFRGNKYAPALTLQETRRKSLRAMMVFSTSDGCYGGMRKGIVNGITVASEVRVLYLV